MFAMDLGVTAALSSLVSMHKDAVFDKPSTVLLRKRMLGPTNQNLSTLFIVS
jgi:hypothetical protein